MPRVKPGPPCDVCGKPSVAKTLCATHYKRWYRHGTTKAGRPDDWGKREKHPLWHSWGAARKIGGGGFVEEWNEFWKFVEGVGERPSPAHILRRYDFKKPFGPENCFWLETKPNRDAAAYQREWNRENPAKIRKIALRRRGIEVEDYDALLESQNGVCAICGKVDKHFSLSIDHDHETNKIRGLLCSKCNRGLGFFRDNINLLKRAIKYLQT